MRASMVYMMFSWLWWGAAVIVTVVMHQWIGFLFYAPWAVFQIMGIVLVRRGE